MLAKKDELKYYIKDSKIAQYEEDIKMYKKSIQISRTVQKEKKSEISKCKNDFADAMIEIDGDTEKSLANVQKQNAFQKMVGAVSNKFNGKKKFNKNVIEPLNANVDYLKLEMIPEIKERIKENVLLQLTNAELHQKQIQDNIMKNKPAIMETTQSKVMKAKDKAKSIFNTSKKIAGVIINEAKASKDSLIINIKETLEENSAIKNLEAEVRRGKEAEAR